MNLYSVLKRCALLSVLGIMALTRPVASQDSAPDHSAMPIITLERAVHGEEAIKILADKLPDVARYHNLTPEDLTNKLRSDKTLWVDRQGNLLYIDSVPPANAPSSSDK